MKFKRYIYEAKLSDTDEEHSEEVVKRMSNKRQYEIADGMAKKFGLSTGVAAIGDNEPNIFISKSKWLKEPKPTIILKFEKSEWEISEEIIKELKKYGFRFVNYFHTIDALYFTQRDLPEFPNLESKRL